MLLRDKQLWNMVHGDCIVEMAKLPQHSMDCAIFSPPFPSVFSYTSLQEDIGNSENLRGDAKLHLSFFYRGLLRLIKPGRVVAVHVTQIGKRKRDGEQGLFDFRGLNIRIGERAGFTYEYDWVIRKDPQAQAIRTRKWELKFQGLETDRSMSRGALPDYIIKFRAPGKNAVPVDSGHQVTRNNWIDWAECVWTDIHPNDTLNTEEAKG